MQTIKKHYHIRTAPRFPDAGKSLAKRRRWYADDDDTKKQETAPASEPAQADTEPPQKTDTVQTFTQDDLNRIAADSRKAGRASADKALLEDLGIDSLDTVKALLEDAKKHKEAEMSEAEKANAELERLNAEHDALVEELEATKTSHLQGQRDTHIKEHLLANGAKAEDIANLLILINATMASDKVALFDEDKPTPETARLEAFTKQVQGNYAMYFGSAGAGSPAIDGAARNPSPAIGKDEALKEIKKKFSNL